MKMERMSAPFAVYAPEPVAAARISANERFRALCATRRWTPEQAAEQFGVSLSLVQAWMTTPDSKRHRAMRRPYELIMNALIQQPVAVFDGE